MAAFSICVLTFNGVFPLTDLGDLCFVNLALSSSAGTELQLLCALTSKLICGYTRFGCRGSQRVGERRASIRECLKTASRKINCTELPLVGGSRLSCFTSFSWLFSTVFVASSE